jgi:hypothetical protein
MQQFATRPPRHSASADDTIVREHWTVSGKALVLTGPRPALETIAQRIAVSPASVIATTSNTAALGVWGPALARYHAQVTLADRDLSHHPARQPDAETSLR